jgi:hypothetical protein
MYMVFRTTSPVTATILGIMHRPVFYLKLYVSETGFCLRLQVGPTHLGQLDITILCFRTVDGDRIQSPNHRVLNKR